MKLAVLALASALTLAVAPVTDACSRATWLGDDGAVITGRSMDWPYDFNTHFYVIPRGFQNERIKGGLTWASKYGAVVAAGSMTPGGPIDGAFDGVNEKGLGANLLYLAEADFGAAPASAKPRISMGAWVTYILSNYATVAEVVEVMKSDPIYIVPSTFGPGGAGHPTVHLSISDASGDSAVIEYIKGKPIIHHDRAYQVMTNSPTFEKQLALNTYWSRMDGSRVLPGSHQSEDRFVRASYYLTPGDHRDRSATAGGGRLLSHAQRLRAVGRTGPGLPEHRPDLLADGDRPHPGGLLFRVRPQPLRGGAGSQGP